MCCNSECTPKKHTGDGYRVIHKLPLVMAVTLVLLHLSVLSKIVLSLFTIIKKKHFTKAYKSLVEMKPAIPKIRAYPSAHLSHVKRLDNIGRRN